MYQLYHRTNFTADSPFQYARMSWLRDRCATNLAKLVDLRKTSQGRMDSSHLLFKILMNLNVEFKGNLESYMESCDTAAKRLVGGLGMTSATSKGRMFTQGVFYPGCPEIITYARKQNINSLDLWRDLRAVSAVEVVTHPITSTKVLDLGVMNDVTIPKPDVAVINIDIPLLAAQWKLWQASNAGKPIENFLTTVVTVGMQKSHLNVAFWNHLQMRAGLKPECVVDANLPFGQIDLTQYVDSLCSEILEKVINKEMTSNQMLSSVPVFFGENYLDTVQLPDMAPTAQVLWAIVTSKMEQAAFTLNVGKIAGYNRLVGDLNVIRRTIRQQSQDKFLSNGLNTATADFLHERFQRLVIDNLPA